MTKAEFVVTDQLVPVMDIGQHGGIRLLGRGPNGLFPQTDTVEYIYFANFAPRETVEVYFYEYCRFGNPGVGRKVYNGVFRIGTSVSVNEEGWAFWEIPPEVRDRLNLTLGYYIVVIGDIFWGNPLGIGIVTGSHSFQYSDFGQTALAFTSNNVDLVGSWGDENDQTLLCPLIPSNFVLRQVLNGHTAEVWDATFLNGYTLASASYDQTIKLWDIENGTLLRTLEGHEFSVLSVSFLRGSKVVSTSNDNTIKIRTYAVDTICSKISI